MEKEGDAARLLKAQHLTPSPENIHRAAQCVRDGGVIAYPTETVYGLGANPFHPQAVARIFDIKGRDAGKGLILLVRGRDDLTTLVAEIPACAETLINAFWPGPLTLVFRARPDLPPALLGGRDTVALRHSDHPIAGQLLNAFGGPLTSTSANRSGQPPAQSALEASAALGDALDFILDGGPSVDHRPSTLLDVSKTPCILLREGRIARDVLRQHIDLA